LVKETLQLSIKLLFILKGEKTSKTKTIAQSTSDLLPKDQASEFFLKTSEVATVLDGVS